MDRSVKKRQHELARKKHKQHLQEYAREAARRRPSNTPAWVLAIGLTLMVVAVVAVTLLG